MITLEDGPNNENLRKKKIYIYSSLAEHNSKPYRSDEPDFGVTVVDFSS